MPGLTTPVHPADSTTSMTLTPLLLKTSPFGSHCPSATVRKLWENQNLGQPNSLPSWPLPPRSKHRCRKSIQLHGLQPQLTLSCYLSLTPVSRKTALKSHLLAPLYLITPPSFFNLLYLASTSTPCQHSPKFITTCILCNPKDTSPFLFSFNFLLRNPYLHSSWLPTFSRLSCSHIFPVVLLLLQPLRWNVLWKLFFCSVFTC